LGHSAPLALGVAVLAASIVQFTYMRTSIENVTAELLQWTARLERRKAAPPVNAAASVPANKVRAINDAITKLNLPWDKLFAVFEASKPDTVALLSLEPDGKKHTLVVQAESKTPEHMIMFAERLRREPMFEEAFLTKHEVREQDVNRPYRFALELHWRDGI
jgi:hypothetical protein